MENSIRCGKWEDLMPLLSDNSINLILTDPPYGMGYISNIPGDPTWNKSGESKNRFEKALEGDDPEENAAIDWRKFFKECYRVLKPDSYCVLHCNVPFVGQKWNDITQSGLLYKGTICWNKQFAIGGDLQGAAKRDWEPIIYLAKGKPKLNPLEVYRKLTKGEKKCKSCKQPKRELQERKRISEIEDWVFSLPKSEKIGHPTQKPVALAKRFIEWMTKRGDLILDPFAGSGTTLVASKLQGRNSVGFEMDEEFSQLAKERLMVTKYP
jgi:site-specific DNA-methyltransferase (adenine-specific)